MNYFIITALHVYTVHVNAVKKLAFGVNQCKVNSISRMQFLTGPEQSCYNWEKQ